MQASGLGEDYDLANSLSIWLSEQLPELALPQPLATAHGGAGPSAGAAGGLQEQADSFDLAALLMQPLEGRFAQMPVVTLPGQEPPEMRSYAAAAQMLSSSVPAMMPPAAAYLPPPPLQQQPGAGLTSLAVLNTVSVKLFGCTPDELPPNMRAQLHTWFDGGSAAASLEGYIRPGCVHLTVQAILEAPAAAGAGGAAAAEPAAPGAGPAGSSSAAAADNAAAHRVVSAMLASGDPLWRTKTLLVQAGSRLVLVQAGQVQQTWDIESASPDRAVPEILHTSPPVVLAAQPPAVCVAGVHLLQDGASIFCRLQGAYVAMRQTGTTDGTCCPPAAASPCCCGSGAAGEEYACNGCCVKELQPVKAEPGSAPGGTCCAAPAPKAAAPAGAQTVWLQPTAPLRPGLMHIVVQKGAYLATRGACSLGRS